MEPQSTDFPSQLKTSPEPKVEPKGSLGVLAKLCHPKLKLLKQQGKEIEEDCSTQPKEITEITGKSLSFSAIVLRHYNQILGHLNRSGFLIDLEFGKMSKTASSYLQKAINRNIRGAGAIGIGLGAIAEVLKNPSLRGVAKAAAAASVAGVIFLATPFLFTGSATLGTSLAVGAAIAVGTQIAWVASVRLVDYLFDNINRNEKKVEKGNKVDQTENLNRKN